VSPELLNLLKEDLIKVLQQYMDIDMDSLIVSIENEENSVALVANIPIKSMRRAANS
jgi:cell division topological specificity factor